MIKKYLTTLILTFTTLFVSAEMNIQIEIPNSDIQIQAILSDNETARDFYQQLPIATTLEDYAEVEKVAYLSLSLSTDNVANRYAGKQGDITYYAPWGNLAIFTQNSRVGSASGLIYIGRITQGLNELENLSSQQTIIIRAIN